MGRPAPVGQHTPDRPIFENLVLHQFWFFLFRFFTYQFILTYSIIYQTTMVIVLCLSADQSVFLPTISFYSLLIGVSLLLVGEDVIE
jgi:hypothetical protein